ncbi:sulfate adenylyltransferase subunit 1 [Geomonas sp. Red276]
MIPANSPLSPALEERIRLVLAGHVDHGKSTLLGRLYADTDSLPEGHLEKVRNICLRQGKQLEYAFLFDAFLEEQEQGITIDTARTFFTWRGRHYLILDAPGHKEFLKNMVTGAAGAEAAVLIIDAEQGEQEQTCRHAYLLGLLGVRQLLVVVNKMDLVSFGEERFRRVEERFRRFLSPLGLAPRAFLPVSAREGDNVVQASSRMPWYDGPTLLESLERLERVPARDDLPLRFPVQDVYKFDARRILAGRVETGQLTVGDQLLFSPSGKSARVRSIEAFNAVPPAEVGAGRSTGFTLSEELFIERGEIASLIETPPLVSSIFRATIFWFGCEPLTKTRRYRIRITTCEVEAEIVSVRTVIDASTQAVIPGREQVGRNEVADVVIRTRRAVALDRFSSIEVTGRFVIVDRLDIVGGGLVVEPLGDGAVEVTEGEGREPAAAGGVTADERALRNGHRPVLVLLQGREMGGSGELAARVERDLFEAGRHAILLDRAYREAKGAPPPSGATAEGEGLGYIGTARVLLTAGHIVIAEEALVPPGMAEAVLPFETVRVPPEHGQREEFGSDEVARLVLTLLQG